MAIPHEVEYIKQFFEKNNFWYILSKNKVPVETCPQAVNYRRRLGNVGITYIHEMKTELRICENGAKEDYILLHCRSNQVFIDNKIEKLIGRKSRRLKPEELESKFGIKKGLVNPFYFAVKYPNNTHFFDYRLFEEYSPPQTLMTNAGHYKWGVEFKPNQIINSINNSIKGDIASDMKDFKLHRIGILTGNSPESGIFLWQKINANIRKKLKKEKILGDISFPNVIIESLPEMGLSMELDLRFEDTKEVVLKGITNLCERGATLICIACNTTQFFHQSITDICISYGVEFISIPVVVENHLQKKGIDQFDFIGIKYVTDFADWSGFSSLAKNYVINIPKEQELVKISEIAFQVKHENISRSVKNQLESLINKATKTDNILIALTELSTIIDAESINLENGGEFIDTISLLAEELAKRYVNGIKKTLYTNPKKN